MIRTRDLPVVQAHQFGREQAAIEDLATEKAGHCFPTEAECVLGGQATQPGHSLEARSFVCPP